VFIQISVNDSLSIECPHCGETFSIAFDVSEGSAEFTIDCEVCCRPMTVAVRVSEDGELEGLDVVEE
jgi:transcription elongation factor Elf1